MHLILFRHGPAGDPDPARWANDADRPLTPKGQDRTRQAARGLARISGEVAFVFTSPYVRAHQTAVIVAEALGLDGVEVLEALASGRPARGVLDALARVPKDQTVVFVGHEPDLGLLAGMLTGSARALPLKKSGACAIAFDGALRMGVTGRLLWYNPPRVLRRLGRKTEGVPG